MIEQPSVESLLQSLRDPSYEVRTDAARRLRDVRPEEVPQSLLEAATDDDLEVRLAVVETLSNFEQEQVIEALQEALFDEEWEVQWAAMRSLGSIWKDNDLRKMGDKLPEKRISGLEAVAKKSAHHLLQPVIASLDDEIEEVQAAGIRTLGELRDPQAIQHLRQILPKASPALQALIIETLDRLGEMEARRSGREYLQSCDECGQKLPPSFLKSVAEWGKAPRRLCQFHFEEHKEKTMAFSGKRKVCKLCKAHWPKIEIVEGACPDCRLKRYHALSPLQNDDQFRCFRCQKQRPQRDLSPVSHEEPLCTKCAYQISTLGANSPFLSQQAIAFLEQAFDDGYLLCERCKQFRPLQEIAEGHDFRDECLCTSCSR